MCEIKHGKPIGNLSEIHGIGVCASNRFTQRSQSIPCGLAKVIVRWGRKMQKALYGFGLARMQNMTNCFLKCSLCLTKRSSRPATPAAELSRQPPPSNRTHPAPSPHSTPPGPPGGPESPPGAVNGAHRDAHEGAPRPSAGCRSPDQAAGRLPIGPPPGEEAGRGGPVQVRRGWAGPVRPSAATGSGFTPLASSSRYHRS